MRKLIMHRIWREVKLAERDYTRGMQNCPLGTVYESMLAEKVPEKGWENEELLHILWELIARLPERLRIVVVARYGLIGQGRTFYPRIGRLLGASHERARQLHTEALLWLRHPAHWQQLRSLLGCHTLAEYEVVEAETQRWLQWPGGRDGC